MQVYEQREHELEMLRDMDIIRDLLLRIEQDPRFDGQQWVAFNRPEDFCGHTREEVMYHLVMLTEAGFIRANIAGDTPMVARLTWVGHEFADDIKDSSVWQSTKARIAGLKGIALAVIAEIAKAEIKKKLGLP